MKSMMPGEYRQKAIAAILVIAVGIAIFMVSQRVDDIFGFIKSLFSALKPVLIGVAIAYLLSPMLRRTEKQLTKILCRKKPHEKLCRAIAVLLCFAVFLAALTAFLWVVVPQVIHSLRSMVSLLLNFINNNAEKLSEFLQQYGIITVNGNDFAIAWEGVIKQAMNYVTTLFTNALAITQDIYSLVLNLLVALAVSVYSLFEKEHFGAQVKKVLYGLLPRDLCGSLVFWMRKSNLIFSGFIGGKIVDSIIMGVLCYICMRIFKMEYPELVSCIFGVTNIVPFFGPLVGGVIGTLLLLIVNPTTAIWFAVMALALQQLDGNVIGPHILGGSIGLSAFWIMLAILVGGGMFGFMGMLLGAPVFAIIYALTRSFVNFRLQKRGLPQESFNYINAPEALDDMDREKKND